MPSEVLQLSHLCPIYLNLLPTLIFNLFPFKNLIFYHSRPNSLQCLRCDKHPSNTPTVPGTQMMAITAGTTFRHQRFSLAWTNPP